MRTKQRRLSCLLWIMLLPGFLLAQTDTAETAVADTTAPAETVAEEAAPEMIAPSLVLTAVQKNDKSIDLKTTLKAKVNGQFYQLYRMKITFYATGGENETELGSVITDGRGNAVFNVKNDTLPLDAEGKLNFKAVFAGNKAMESAEEVVGFKKAMLSITPVKAEDALSVQVKLTDAAESPVKDVTVGVYVKRLFQAQKIGEGTTDENGEAVIEFPPGLPGDAKGNLTLVARVDENESFGNLEASAVEAWGKAVSDKSVEQPRALWSSHPPLWMLITFFVLMAAVWGHYLVIVYELFRLRKEEPHLAK